MSEEAELRARIVALEKELRTVKNTLDRFERALIKGDADTGALALVVRARTLEENLEVIRRRLDALERHEIERAEDRERKDKKAMFYAQIGGALLTALLIGVITAVVTFVKNVMELVG